MIGYPRTFLEKGTPALGVRGRARPEIFDGEVWLWNIEDSAIVRRWASSGQPIVVVEFLDNNTLLVLPEGNVAVALTLDIDQQLAAARSRLTRGFTDQECASYSIDPCRTLDDLRNR